MDRTYIAIDLKSFYASVECVERGLDPLTAKLVVADESRTDKTICLAVSPALKKIGVPGRPRLFQAKEIAKGVDFIIAPPRMKKYIEVSRKIVEIYLDFVAAEDLYVYSIDEVFIDATGYLGYYQKTAEELAREIVGKILEATGITATVGIGENLYLAKVAMDVLAKRMEADENGVRVARLTERSYREKMWDHKPITDFWRIGPGIAKRLGELGIETMGELAKYAVVGSEKLYKVFGVNAELIIDHAYGWEPVTIKDIKNYEPSAHSISSGQVLHQPYEYEKAKLVIAEMAEVIASEVGSKYMVAEGIVLWVGYEKERNGEFSENTFRGTAKFLEKTANVENFIREAVRIFVEKADKRRKVRKISITAMNVEDRYAFKQRKEMKQMDFFTDYRKVEMDEEKAKRRQDAITDIRNKYGKNAILRAMNLEKDATTVARNSQVGGHKA